MTIAELLKSVLGDQPPFWAAQFEDWVRSSRRFRSFAETYRDKVHKKLRTAQNEAGLLDLFFELETAYRLLNDQRFVVEYEKFGFQKGRAPDFSIAYRVNTLFNLEVTRLRTPQADSLTSDELDNLIARKLTDSVCDKLGQMRPASINLLLIIADLDISADIMTGVMSRLRLNAEQKQDAWFAQYGFEDARDFLRQFQQLNAIVCRNLATNEVICWLNSLARNPVSKELFTALQKSLVGQ